MLIKEPDQTAQSVVIWLHGLGASADDFAPCIPLLGLAKEHRIRFIFPQAPSMPVTCNANIVMPAWFDIIKIGQLEPEDSQGIIAAAANMRDLVAQQQQQGIPLANITLVGFSQGAALALYTALTFNEPLGGVVALSGYLPVCATQHLQQQSYHPCRALIAHGQQDDIVPLSASEQMHQQLTKAGFSTTFQTHAEGHTVSMGMFKKIGQWLQEHTT